MNLGSPIQQLYASRLFFADSYYLPSGRIFLLETADGSPVECTEMRDVATDGKSHAEVRTALDPKVIWRHLVPYEEKWLLTVSTQKGCTYRCTFCDVPNLPFRGNLSQEEIETQVRFLLASTPYVHTCRKAKIGFARMGEPAQNLDAVLGAMRNLADISLDMNRSMNWLPCFNSIIPVRTTSGDSAEDVIHRVIETKERSFDGFLHFQISCNSTDEDRRRELFGGAKVLPIEDIIRIVNATKITNRTITLNFIVMKGVPVNVESLVKMGMTRDRFTVKLIPLNATLRGDENGLETYANYDNYNDLARLADEFRNAGIPTMFDAIAKCEEAGLCCGQLAHIHARSQASPAPS